MHNKTNEQTKRIAIKGGYGCGNFGDDALMVAVNEITKRVLLSESFIFICRDANYISKIVPGAKVVPHDSKIAKTTDMLVYGGGTQFYSFPLTAKRGVLSFFRRIGRNIRTPSQLGQKLLQIMPKSTVKVSSRRVIAIGIGLGPFIEDYRSMRKTKKLFSCMDYIAVRDCYSYDLCKQWGLQNVSLRADLCYLPKFWEVDLQELSVDNTKRQIQKIGVIPRDWPHTTVGDSYTNALFQAVRELRNEGQIVEFILFANDNEWAKRLKDKDEQFIVWNPGKWSISEFMEILSGYDAFITARYHGAVFASILGKPVVCIDVERKLRLVSDLLGVGARFWTYPFSASKCLRHISDLEVDYSVAVRYLARFVEEQGSLVETMIDEYQQCVTTNPIG